MNGAYNAGPENEYYPEEAKTLDATKIRMLDIWGNNQPDAVKNLDTFSMYDFGYPWWHRVTLVGAAQRGLTPDNVGVKVKKGQQVWCLSGTGTSWPEYVDGVEGQQGWEAKTSLHKFDLDAVNRRLAKVVIKNS